MGQVWDLFLNFIFGALQFFYVWVRDYGWAIILLTIAMRIIMTPLTWKQTKSMYELQRIQPKLKELQTKYKDDKEKLQEETLKFYQENKVNPFGGCLPLLAQMPIFIGLYNVLGGTPAKPGKLMVHIAGMTGPAKEAASRFWLVLPDITKSPQLIWSTVGPKGIGPAVLAVLPYAIFVVLFGLSIWLPQYMMTQDPTQRRTGTYMAVFMLYIGWISPAGVLIYWVTSSAWQVGQQWLTMRILDRAAPEEDAAGSAKKRKADKALPAESEDGEAESSAAQSPNKKTGGSKSRSKKKRK